jgi:probable HAF family extracellular repeat protein/YD repeat-containing protein
LGINASGVAVGAGRQAFAVSLSGELTRFPEIDPNLGPASTYAYAINDHAQVTGGFLPPPGDSPYQVFRYSAEAGFVTLGTLPGLAPDTNYEGFAIDNSGRIVGRAYPPTASLCDGHAFRYTDATGMQDLNALALPRSGFQTLVAGTATNGTLIAGWGCLPDGYHIRGFRYHEDGTVDQIPTLPPPVPVDQSVAYGINQRGDIVGTAFGNGGGNNHAFVYTAAGKLININDFVDPASGWTLESAAAINDYGEVVGYGTHGDSRLRAFKIRLPDLSQ